MNSYIIRPNKQLKQVKNLGWILRNWRYVSYFGFNYLRNKEKGIDGQLIAKLNDETLYSTDCSCLSVLWNFLDRPVFRTKPFHIIFGPDYNRRKDYIIGNSEWKRINKLEYKQKIQEICS